jgi:hypothetical protein
MALIRKLWRFVPFVAFAIFWIRHHPGDPRLTSQYWFDLLSSDSTHLANGAKRGNLSRFRYHLLRDKPFAESMVEKSALSEFCKPFVLNLLGRDFNGFDEKKSASFLFNRDLPKVPQACSFRSSDSKAAERFYNQICFASNPSRLAGVNSDCLDALMVFRASLTRAIALEKPAESQEGLSELADLIFLSYKLPALQSLQPRYGDIQKYARGFAKLDANVQVIARIRFVSMVRTWDGLRSSKGYAEQDQVWKELKTIIGNYGSDPNDPTARMMKVFLDSRGFNPKTLMNMTMEGKNAESLLLKAFALWRSDDISGSMTSVMEAARAAPENPMYAKVYQGLSAPNTGQEVFFSALGLELKSEDFEK